MLNSNQLLDVSAGFLYSFFATFTLLLLSNLVLKALRPIVKYLKIRTHEFLRNRNEGYRERVGDYDPRAEVDLPWHRAKVVKDKLVALEQHNLFEMQEIV